jgi:hypothetical protein
VSIKHRLRKVLLCMALGLASLAGAPMRPEEIEELMYQMNQPRIAHALPDESDRGLDWDYGPVSTIEIPERSR